MSNYIHGFTSKEQERLMSQASFLAPMIYPYLDFSESKRLLEMGCGTGAQTLLLLEQNPEMHITACDISEVQLNKAKENIKGHPESHRVEFVHLDGSSWPFDDQEFDTVFFCWVLEHTTDPLSLLKEASRVMIPGGRVMLTEVYNSSLRILPDHPALMKYWKAYNDLQSEMGDPDVGIKLGNYLNQTGFKQVANRTMQAQYDESNHEAKIDMLNYWESLILSGKDQLLEAGRIDNVLVEELKACFEGFRSNPNSVFFYSGIQTVGCK